MKTKIETMNETEVEFKEEEIEGSLGEKTKARGVVGFKRKKVKKVLGM